MSQGTREYLLVEYGIVMLSAATFSDSSCQYVCNHLMDTMRRIMFSVRVTPKAEKEASDMFRSHELTLVRRVQRHLKRALLLQGDATFTEELTVERSMPMKTDAWEHQIHRMALLEDMADEIFEELEMLNDTK